MTNRERLMADLSALDNAALYHALTDNRAISRLEINQCDDCKAKHDGACPWPDDDACNLDTETYMDWPCTRPRIYPPED